MKKLSLIVLSLLFIITLSACKEDTSSDIYVTVYPMEYLVETLVGDSKSVGRIPGSSTHGDYEQWTAKEIIDMKHADLLFYINAGVDNFVPNNAETFEDGDVELIDMSEQISYNMVCYTHDHDDEAEEHTDEHDGSCDETTLNPDPHFWLDPVLMKEAATLIKDKLISIYPELKETIELNYAHLSTELTELDTKFTEMAAEATKPIITTVMLFTYWHERYDIEILSITTDAHSSDLIPSDIIDFVNHAKEDGVMHIMFEKNSNSPAGDKLLEELQTDDPTTSALFLHGIGNITVDEYEAGETYLTLMYDNLEALRTATK